jgi:hypothetical protein
MHKGKKHKSVIEGYNDFARSEGAEAKKYVDSIRKNDPFAKGVDDMMDEESRRRESGYYVEGTVIKSPKKEKSPLNHCESDMMHQGGWAKMRTINSPGTTGNKEGIAHNEKMRGFKLPHQSPLNKKGEKDACYHKVKSRVKVWPSAYASGQLVQCRKAGAANWGEKSKKK